MKIFVKKIKDLKRLLTNNLITFNVACITYLKR